MSKYKQTMRDVLSEMVEKFSPKEIKMAIGIASDKRYAGGNMTGAVNAIEKIKKGLSKHKQVAAVLKRQNEDIQESGHDDVASAKNQVKVAMSALQKMETELGKLNDEDSLPTWWTNKVAVSVDKLDGMADYLDTQVEEVELDEKVEYVEYKFKNKNDAMAAKKMLDGIQLMSFDINDDNISGGELAVDAGSKDMTKYHKEIMKKFRPKVVTQETIDEGTWAVPETPAQKRDLKKLLSKPLPLGKEGENASDKMYSIIGDDELFDDLYSAGKESPDSDARPIIKKAMKRLKIREDSWDTWRLDESTKPDHIKIFNSLKKGDKVEINYDSAIAGGTTKTFVIKTKNKVYKGRVDKVTMYPDGKTGGVKFHLYQYDNRPGVYMAIGDMGASLRDIKKI